MRVEDILMPNNSQRNREQVCIAMLGPRLHYAFPEVLHRTGLLWRFYTDSYSGNKPAFRGLLSWLPRSWLPGSIKRWIGRTSVEIPSNRVRSFELFGLAYALRRSKAKNESDRVANYALSNAEFGRKVIQSGFGPAKIVVGFNGASEEIFKAAKSRGLVCVLEQTMLPHILEEELIAQEKKIWGISESTSGLKAPLANREAEEWIHADYIIAGSDFVSTGLQKLGVPSQKIRVIPYGVDPKNFPYSPRSFNGEALKVVFVGQVGLRKGVPHLLEALSRIEPQKIQAVIVGQVDLPTNILEKYDGVATFTGQLPRDEVHKLYQWADVFVLPSIVEGSATVTYEAILSGLPIIVTPNAGSIIKDDQAGRIVSCSNPDEIEAALRLYIDSPDTYHRHAAETLELAKLADIKRYQEELAQFFHEISTQPGQRDDT